MNIDVNALEFFGVNAFHFAVGFLGGLLRSLSRTGESLTRRAATAITGAFCAGYLTPVIAPLVQNYVERFGVEIDHTSGLVGFLLGIGGLTICEAAIARVVKFFAK
jgi:hypothetical protein